MSLMCSSLNLRRMCSLHTGILGIKPGTFSLCFLISFFHMILNQVTEMYIFFIIHRLLLILIQMFVRFHAFVRKPSNSLERHCESDFHFGFFQQWPAYRQEYGRSVLMSWKECFPLSFSTEVVSLCDTESEAGRSIQDKTGSEPHHR